MRRRSGEDNKEMEGKETDSRWETKTAGRSERRRSDTEMGGGEKERRWRRRSLLKETVIGLTVGDGVLLLLGGTCVFQGVGEGYRLRVEVTQSRRGLLLYRLSCTALYLCFYTVTASLMKAQHAFMLTGKSEAPVGTESDRVEDFIKYTSIHGPVCTHTGVPATTRERKRLIYIHLRIQAKKEEEINLL